MNKNNENAKGKHLTLEDRTVISVMLKQGESIRAIAKVLKRSPSTIMREVRVHSVEKKSKRNDCLNKKDCVHKGLCSKKNNGCVKLCKGCSIPCKKLCPDYAKGYCERLQNPPHVCNGCSHMNLGCDYDRMIYDPNVANTKYKDTLRNTRNGFDLTGEQFRDIDELVTPLIKKGQSVYHIVQTQGDKLPVSESTLRRLIDKGELGVRNIDLPEAVRRRPRRHRKQMKSETSISASKLGHLYSDYLEYVGENDVSVVEMDCVEGTKTDSAVLLTLHFPEFHMQIALILDEHTAECVVYALNKIEESIGTDMFREIFPVILTDNGHEFTDIDGMERSINGGQRTKIFFCEPNRSDEKGACENNHKLLRRIIPKGMSLEPYDQSDISLMMNHVNSQTRKSLHGITPYDAAMAILPEDFFILLGLEKIPPDEVQLNPSLLKQKVV